MRLFVGIDLPEPATRHLSQLIGQLRPLAAIRWSRPANLHITTKFIGEWPESRLDEMKSALSGAANLGGFPVILRGLGWFPNARAPRIFWIGVEAGRALAELALATAVAVETLGVAREDRPYRPHLTLARLSTVNEHELAVLRQAIAPLETNDFFSFEPAAFHLYESKPRPGGPVYTKLASYSLRAA